MTMSRACVEGLTLNIQLKKERWMRFEPVTFLSRGLLYHARRPTQAKT